MKYNIVVLLIYVLPISSIGQKSFIKIFCGLNSQKEVKLDRNILNNADAETALRNILEKSGLPDNIKIYPSSDVPNARATAECSSLNECERIILYNPKFLKRVNKNSENDWAAISIIAHEVGHHLAGHTIEAAAHSGTELKNGELQADEYAGFILANLGSSLNDAISAVKEWADEKETDTHPCADKRIEAIRRGWNKNKGIKTEKPSASGQRSRPTSYTPTSSKENKLNMKSSLNSSKKVLIYNANDINGSAKRMGEFLNGKVSGFRFDALTFFVYRSLYSKTKILYIKPEYKEIAEKIEALIPKEQEVIDYSDKRVHGFFGLENREIVIFVGKDWN